MGLIISYYYATNFYGILIQLVYNDILTLIEFYCITTLILTFMPGTPLHIIHGNIHLVLHVYSRNRDDHSVTVMFLLTSLSIITHGCRLMPTQAISHVIFITNHLSTINKPCHCALLSVVMISVYKTKRNTHIIS